MFDDDAHEQGPRGTFEIYKAEGDILFKNGEYHKVRRELFIRYTVYMYPATFRPLKATLRHWKKSPSTKAA